MQGNPLISVIMIFLNAVEFIEEAIDSVLAQAYDNWELLLVDDGSTDTSTEIALRYAAQYPERIRYLAHKDHQNLGKNVSLNLGIRKAKGKYLAFLDADDIYLPHKLTHDVAVLEAHPEAAMMYEPTLVWHGWTGNQADIDRDFLTHQTLPLNTLVSPPDLLIRLLQDERNVPCNCGLLVGRDVAERVGGFDESFHNQFADINFHVKIFLEFPVFLASECCSKYRHHATNSTVIARKTGEFETARLKYLHWVKDYLSTQGVKDQAIWQALRKALWRFQYPRLHRILSAERPVAFLFKRLMMRVNRRVAG